MAIILNFFLDNLLGEKSCPVVLICVSLMTRELNIYWLFVFFVILCVVISITIII